MKRGGLMSLGLLLMMGLSLYGQNSIVSGHVMYKNLANTALKDSTFVYLKQGNIVIATDTVDSTGYYQFTNIPAGTYTVRSFSIKKWGGCNSTDCLLILRHFVGLQPQLTGLNLIAADINQSGGVPASVDALGVQRRFVGMISNFLPAPDWYSTVHTLVITSGDTLIQDIRMLTAGDVNGSYIPW